MNVNNAKISAEAAIKTMENLAKAAESGGHEYSKLTSSDNPMKLATDAVDHYAVTALSSNSRLDGTVAEKMEAAGDKLINALIKSVNKGDKDAFNAAQQILKTQINLPIVSKRVGDLNKAIERASSPIGQKVQKDQEQVTLALDTIETIAEGTKKGHYTGKLYSKLIDADPKPLQWATEALDNYSVILAQHSRTRQPDDKVADRMEQAGDKLIDALIASVKKGDADAIRTAQEIRKTQSHFPIVSKRIKDLDQAINSQKPLDAGAQYELAMRYYHGSGVKKDINKANDLLKEAADKENVAALYQFGQHNEFGRGIRKNEGEAFKLYEKAAEKGHAGAQWRLAVCYRDGTGISPANIDKAIEWCQRAANQGQIEAKEELKRLQR